MTDTKRTLNRIRRRFPDAVEILATAPVLYSGWELDNEAWLVKMKGGSKKLITTSHGGVYEMPVEELQEKIEEYRQALRQSEALLEGL